MKKQEKAKIRQQTQNEITKLLTKKRAELLKAIVVEHEEKDKNKVKNLQREIAFLLTIMREKQIKIDIGKAGGAEHA